MLRRMLGRLMILALVTTAFAVTFPFRNNVVLSQGGSVTKVYVDPQNVTANVGENVTIYVKVANVSNFYGIDLQFTWDPNTLKYVSHQKHIPVEDYPDGVLHEPTIPAKDVVDENASIPGSEPGTRYWLSEASFLADSFNGSGVIFEMTFEVQRVGACYLHIVSCTLADKAGNPISHDLYDGFFWNTLDPSYAPIANFTYYPEKIYVNRTVVVFNASSSFDPDGVIMNYTWDFGDGNVTTTQNPVINHTYHTKLGNEAVTLIVEDDEDNFSYMYPKKISAETYNDVGLTALSVPFQANRGEKAKINVTIANLGDAEFKASLPVFAWYNVTNMVDFSDPSKTSWRQAANETYTWGLQVGENTTLYLEWDTTGVPIATYYILCNFSYADGNLTNNLLISPTPIQLLEVNPTASFYYEPKLPILYEPITFDASSSFDPDGVIMNYTWDFGDGNVTVTDKPTIIHVFEAVGVYRVNLTVTDNSGLSNSFVSWIQVYSYYPLEIVSTVGDIHFRGEIAEFYILVLRQGRPVDVSDLKAKLFFDGTVLARFDYPTNISNVETGLYRIVYYIGLDSPAGTYNILVNAYVMAGDTRLESSTIDRFQVSPTFTGWNAMLLDLNGTVATIKTDVGTIIANLTSINATLIGISDRLISIDTSLGTLETSLKSLNATVTRVDGNVITVNTVLGEVKDIGGATQSMATYGLIASTVFSAIAAFAAVLILLGKYRT